ncbi:MAG: DUF222 domain-containing protein [Acidimicrobiia bacterium]|jgi:hypothetical protein
MFDSQLADIELLEPEDLSWENDDLSYLITIDEMKTGWSDDAHHFLPDLSSIPPGPYLAMLLEFFDREKLNGFDVVRLLQARERQLAHIQAQAMADTVETAYSAPGHSGSDVERLQEQFEYAADELRPALTLSRRAAEYKLSMATSILEQLPQVWVLLDQGHIDLPKARAFVNGTCHLPPEIARSVVAQLADVAQTLTVGQLQRRIRKLCITIDPEHAAKREKTAHEDRRLVIEPTEDGVGDLHLFGIKLGDARAIGRRVNRHMISLKKEDRSGRTHDQLRADIARDLLLGELSSGGGRGLVDIHVPVATLEGSNEPGHIGGLGPVTAETAREIVGTQPEADHQITLVDEKGLPTHIYTLSRRATRRIRRHMQALQPTCSFPGCVAPAVDCDYDHASRASLELSGVSSGNSNLSVRTGINHQRRPQM